MGKMAPYLVFNGNCEEAMRFYGKVFNGKLTLIRASESSAFDNLPKEKKNQIMHSSLTIGDALLEACDALNDIGLNHGNTVSLNYDAENVDELKSVFKGLSEGAKIETEVGKQFWGGYYASLIDKFGYRWMLTSSA